MNLQYKLVGLIPIKLHEVKEFKKREKKKIRVDWIQQLIEIEV